MFPQVVVLLGLLALSGADTDRAAAVRPAPGGLAGQLLVATDELTDPRFVRTVIYMIRHDASGAMGLVVNRPMKDVPLAPLLEEFGVDSTGVSGDIWLHYGGPVERARGFTLHTADYTAESTVRVDEKIALTVGPEVLRAIGTGMGPRRALVALGYAGWAPGQLEREIESGAWIGVPADEALVFDDQHDTKWERAMAKRTITL
jgi:putative transcriptional regulator